MAEKTTSTPSNPNAGGGLNASSVSTTKSSNFVAYDTHLETNKADKHVWLMKCPSLVARSFLDQMSPLSSDNNPRDSPSSAGPVAKVIVAVDPLLPNDNFSSTQFTMELASTGSANAPKCYSMDMSKDFIPMSVFSESAQGKLYVEGKIDHKFDMKPHTRNLEDYGKFCRERTNKSLTKNRKIQVIDDDSGQHLRPKPGFISIKGSAPPEKKKIQAKGSEMKRTRRGRDEMEEIMFKLFERQPNWTLKQLIQETNQPEQFLKDMLKLLCVYNNKGSNQGTYELKPEYKTPKDNPDSKNS